MERIRVAEMIMILTNWHPMWLEPSITERDRLLTAKLGTNLCRRRRPADEAKTLNEHYIVR